MQIFLPSKSISLKCTVSFTLKISFGILYQLINSKRLQIYLFLCPLIIFILLLNINVLYSRKSSENTNLKQSKKEMEIQFFFMEGLSFYVKRDFKRASELWWDVLELEPSHNKAKIYYEKAFKKYQDMTVNFLTGKKMYNKAGYKDAITYLKRTLFIKYNITIQDW